MTLTISTLCLVMALILCIFAWYTKQRAIVVLLPWIAAIGVSLIVSATGQPRFIAPPRGEYTVLGFRIDIDRAIYILMEDGSGNPPTYFVLPYSANKANELQEAKDEAGPDGVVSAEVGDGGGGDGGESSFHGEAPVRDEDLKAIEAPPLIQQ